MNALRGAKEFELGGKKRLIKFGTNQTKLFCELRCLNMAQYLEFAAKLQTLEVDIAFLPDLIYTGLLEGARFAKQEVDFDNFDVSDWLDEAGEEIGAEILEVYREGNGPKLNRSQRRAEEQKK